MDIKDFQVGQTVWVELTGNSKRGKSETELIEEWEITTVGKKYIYAQKKGENYPIQFEKHNNRFVEKTNYCVDYILYLSKQELLDDFEKRKLLDEVSKFFKSYVLSKNISLEQLRRIFAIINEGENG